MAADRQQETTARGPIRLYDKATGKVLMEITPDQLQRLQDALEEEFPEDHDYYINVDTLDYLFARGVDAPIVDRLREALSTRYSIEFLWRSGDTPPDELPSGPGSQEAQR